MNISIVCFTQKGKELELNIAGLLSNEHTVKLYAKYDGFTKEKLEGKKDTLYTPDITKIDESIGDWAKGRMKAKDAIIFIGAMGIAVRAIASGIKDKLTDSPVIVIDELGTYVIPILSGHIGGANELAIEIAERTGFMPVITTATDIEGAFPVDLFAKENHLAIMNREGIAKVSSKALLDRPVRICIENFPKENQDDIGDDEPPTDVYIGENASELSTGSINLCPKTYALGIGCRKNTDSNKLREFILDKLNAHNIDIRLVGAIGSIDLKCDEEAIISFAREYRIPFITFTKEVLKKAKGEYEESPFVEDTVGVGNVCERAAMVLTNNKGAVVVPKIKEDGMTLAVCKLV